MEMVGRMAGSVEGEGEVVGGAREQALTLLNEAKLQTDIPAKTDMLKQLKEIVLYRDPSLLQEFVPHLLEFHTDRASPIRKCLAELIEEIGLKHLEHIPSMVPVLLALLQDDTPAVARSTISSGANLFRKTLEQVAMQGIRSGCVEKWLEESWIWVTRLKDAIYPAAYQHRNDGVRFHAMKFVETAILLFTADPNGSSQPPQSEQNADGFNVAWIVGGHPVLDAGVLGQEVSRNLGLLLDQLRPPEVSKLPSPVAIVLVTSLAAIARKRPSLYGRVLPVLLGLGPNCEAMKGAQVASVVHALKNAFLSLLKCTHSVAGPWRERLVSALRAMNAGEVAETVVRQMDRMLRNAEKERSSYDTRIKDDRSPGVAQGPDGIRKRPSALENGNQACDADDGLSKRVRVNSSAAQPVSGVVQDLGASGENFAVAGSSDHEQSPLQQMIAMIGALVAKGERAAASIELLITSLPPDMLADIVIENMKNLPATAPPLPVGVGSASEYSGGALVSTVQVRAAGETSSTGALVAHSASSAAEGTVSGQMPVDHRRDLRSRDPRRVDPRKLAVPIGVSQSQAPVKIDELSAEAAVSNVTLSTRSETLIVLNRDSHRCEPSENNPGNEASVPSGASESIDASSSMPMVSCKSEPLSPISVTVPFLSRETQSTFLGTALVSAPGTLSHGIPSSVSSNYLTQEQQATLSKAALVRILEGHKLVSAAGGGELRTSLLARLIAQSYGDGEILELLQRCILADYQNQKGHDIAIHTLYQLFTEQICDANISDTVGLTCMAYEKFLISVAQGLRDNLPPSDKALSRLLSEAPMLPDASLKLLEAFCNPRAGGKEGIDRTSSDRVTQGLSAVWSLILFRPPMRAACLRIALQCAVHEIEEVRAKAIRLVANKLYPLDYACQTVEEFATRMLQSVLEMRTSHDGARVGMDNDELAIREQPAEKEAERQGPLTNNQNGNETSVSGVSSSSDDQRQSNRGPVHGTDAMRCMSLYFALCVKKNSLLRHLFSMFGHAPKLVRQAVKWQIPTLIHTIGPLSPELLQIISDPFPGSKNLVLQVLHILTESNAPPGELIAAVKQFYEKTKDAVVLIPILSSLSKDEVLPIFPRLVDLSPENFKAALARILQGSVNTDPALTPAEVLIAIHGIDPERDCVPLSKVKDACSICFQQRTVFTQQVLAKVLNQLVEQTPLPMLFMRTVIQAVGAFHSLVNFVMEILSRLVSKQIWKSPTLWVGFLKCADQTQPHSFHVLLQLPAAQLEKALHKHPNLRQPLTAYANQINIRSTLPRSTLVVLGLAQDSQQLDPSIQNQANADCSSPPQMNDAQITESV